MKRETLIQHLFEHGRITAYVQGTRQVIWGVIADVTSDQDSDPLKVRLLNHSAEIQKFDLKDVKGFRIEPYQHTRKALKLKCDCGCKAEQRYVCGNCGATFCGTKHGIQERDKDGNNLDLCDSCAGKVLQETGIKLT